MSFKQVILNELNYLSQYSKTAILISTTAKHRLRFRPLPRRVYSNIAMSSFMINDKHILNEVLSFYDGKIDNIYIDIEQKQDLNLFEIAREVVKKSRLITMKPNDTTLESCDFLVRQQQKDDLYNKNIIVIGTGNLASKIAVRLAERQANVFIKGRTIKKENALINGLNLFLPRNTAPIVSFTQVEDNFSADVIISFLSGEFTEEGTLFPHIDKNTIIIDGGINNFSSNFIHQMLSDNIQITRLDTRIALPYQMLSNEDYIQIFFSEIYGQNKIGGITVVSGGYIGAEGTVIVDNIKRPSQSIGIADGKGGVKAHEQLSKTDRDRLRKIEQTISTHY
ncbi:hypothetical protein KQI49_01670 [Virgibacillus sp. MSJ-26]|uniref:hypothetical protein n=1 Tax=Virgibacillus sp. MSJ-26 TaxID=2841522 RepID=UPI001C104376|nr:hypothetical protein [Virgibacillus sp. MSJ-26]